jgi:hypothetical protein
MNSGPFSQTNISKRIAELPRLSTDDIRSLLDRAKVRNITELVEACSAELAARPISYDSSRAERNTKMSEIVQDKEQPMLSALPSLMIGQQTRPNSSS